MSKEKEKQAAAQPMQIQFPGDLEYNYRDFFTVYAGPEDFVLEFGNLVRAQQGQVRMGDRIVLSPSNAVRLRDVLDRTINEMARRIRSGAPETK